MPLTKIETIETKECAILFGVCEGTIYRLARNGELTKAFVYGANGRYFLIEKDDKFKNQLELYHLKNRLKSKKRGD